MSDQPHWRVARDAVFVWRRFDDEYLVYHENSGDTHRLNALGARTLEVLATDALTRAELEHRLRSLVAPAAVLDTIDLGALLEHLHGLGLLERDAPVVAQPAGPR